METSRLHRDQIAAVAGLSDRPKFRRTQNPEAVPLWSKEETQEASL
jgi:hypothetical protein